MLHKPRFDPVCQRIMIAGSEAIPPHPFVICRVISHNSPTMTANPPSKPAPAPISFWSPALLVAEADAEVADPVAVFDELVPVPEAVLEPEVVVPVAPVALLAALDEVELADETHETTDGKLVTPEVLHRFWA